MTVMVELHGWVPAGPLTVADMPGLDLDVPFEIIDVRLEIMSPPSLWHQHTAHQVGQMLERRYPYVTGDVTLAIGDNGRRPDTVALILTWEEILRQKIKTVVPEIVEVAVEVISHDDDDRRDRILVARDREIKYHEYAAAGIPEYWVVDEIPDAPQDAQVEIHHLRDGHYVPVTVARLSDLISGAVEIPAR